MHSLLRRATATRIGSFARPPSVQFNQSIKMATAQATSTSGVDPLASQILEYWFGPGWDTAGPWTKIDPVYKTKWFGGGPTVDQECISQFTSAYNAMRNGTLDTWLKHPINTLAGIVLLDQFSRNMFRGSSKTYDMDHKALAWAKHLVDNKLCHEFNVYHRFFVAMPFDHSEDVKDQERCIELTKSLLEEAKAAAEAGNTDAADAVPFLEQIQAYAIAHWEVVAKWGRFPHRNVILGRESTPEEIAGLADGTIRSFA